MIFKQKNLTGAWSATPTPFTSSLKIDKTSIKRMVRHHIRLGVKGLFVGGTSGEGPLLTQDECRTLTSEIADANNARLIIALQVTDNSPRKILEKLAHAKQDGADVGIVAEPWFRVPFANETIFRNHFLEILEKSPLPIGIYCREVIMSPDIYAELLMHPNVLIFKDSSMDPDIMQVAGEAAKNREDLLILTGNEFMIKRYLKANYQAVLAGGGILIGGILDNMLKAALEGDYKKVDRLQGKSTRILETAYGGKQYKSWLTGLKYTLVKLGIFRTTESYIQYPLPASVARRIDVMIEKERETLLP